MTRRIPFCMMHGKTVKKTMSKQLNIIKDANEELEAKLK